MKLLHCCSALLLSLLMTLPLWGGNEKGNGGYAVICKNPKAPFRAYEILDFTEGRLLRDLEPDLGGPELSTFKKLEVALIRLETWAPSRVHRYREWASTFVEETKFLRGVDLGDIGDTDHIAIPEGCSLKAVINQREPSIPGDKRYFINQDLWEHLDADNQAGLILHEFIYRELQTPTSVKVRYYTSIISSRVLENLKLPEVIQIHRNAGLHSIDIQGVEVNLDFPIQFYPNQNLKSAYPIPGSILRYRGQSLRLYSWISEPGPRDPQVAFYEDGTLKSFVPKDPFPFVAQSLPLYLVAYADRPIEFWPNGQPLSGMVRIRSSTILETPWVRLEIGRDPYSGSLGDVVIRFYPSGGIAYVSDGTGLARLGHPPGHWVPVHRGYRSYGIELYEDGSLKSAQLKEPVALQFNPLRLNLTDQCFLFSNHGLAQGTLTNNQKIEVQNKQVLFLGQSQPIEFYDNGHVRCGHLARRESLKTVSHTTETFSYGVCFTPEGLVDPALRPGEFMR
jgi:hypothetical protein